MRVSIRNKWTIALVAAAWLPLVLAFWRGLDAQREGLRRVEQELEAAVADQVSAEVTLSLQEVRSATHEALKTALDERLAPDLRIAFLRERVGLLESMQALVIYDEEGAFVDAVTKPGATIGREPLDRTILAEVFEQGRSLDVAGQPQARISFAEHLDKKLVAVGIVDTEMLMSHIRALATSRFGNAERVRLFYGTRQGTVAALTGGELGADLVPDPSRLSESFVRTTEFESHGESMSGTLRSIPALKMAVSVTRPTREAYASLERTKRQFAASLAGAAALAVLVGLVLARRVTRPIASLVGLVQRYARREFTATNRVHTGDELETLGIALESMAGAISSGEEEIKKRAALEAGLARFLPTDVARQIAAGERSLELGGERRRITVLFADVSNFTGFSENRDVEEVVTFLNELFSILSEVVFRHGGIVDKFVGDCVMALFGAHQDGPSESAAVAAAEDMMRFVESNAASWKKRWGFDVSLGIGLASGTALVGNLGSESRMEFTAIGDVVNVAARLESMARPGQVLMTSAVVEGAPKGFEYEALGKVPLRGKRDEVELFALVTE